MTDAAQKPWEVKLHGFRKTQDGVVVSFVIHPQEVPRALALDDLGTRYGMALARIEDEQATESGHTDPPYKVDPPPDIPADAQAPQSPVSAPEPDKPGKKFTDYPRSQQAAMACQDVRFQEWMGAKTSDGQVAARGRTDALLKVHMNISSKTWLDDPNRRFGDEWDALYARFLAETGREAEQR